MQDVEVLINTLRRADESDRGIVGDTLEALWLNCGDRLSYAQRQQISLDAVSIFLARGSGTYDGGKALDFLEQRGTASAAISCLEAISAQKRDVDEVEYVLGVINACLERDKATLADETLVRLSNWPIIDAVRQESDRQWERDEFGEIRLRPTWVGAVEIKRMAERERSRRAGKI
jgi:hypothetical protein